MTNGTITYIEAIEIVRGKLADLLAEEESRRLQAHLDKLRETFTDTWCPVQIKAAMSI